MLNFFPRDTTIQKWYDKTRLAAGKVKGKSFSAFDQSAVVQIKQVMLPNKYMKTHVEFDFV